MRGVERRACRPETGVPGRGCRLGSERHAEPAQRIADRIDELTFAEVEAEPEWDGAWWDDHRRVRRASTGVLRASASSSRAEPAHTAWNADLWSASRGSAKPASMALRHLSEGAATSGNLQDPVRLPQA